MIDRDLVLAKVATLDRCLARIAAVRGVAAFDGGRTPESLRGWRRLYAEHVLPRELGCDLDFS